MAWQFANSFNSIQLSINWCLSKMMEHHQQLQKINGLSNLKCKIFHSVNVDIAVCDITTFPSITTVFAVCWCFLPIIRFRIAQNFPFIWKCSFKWKMLCYSKSEDGQYASADSDILKHNLCISCLFKHYSINYIK